MSHDPRKLHVWLPALAVAVLSMMCNAAAPKALVEATLEYQGTASNYDDPCFWQDPNDPRRALACITSKSHRLVECFDLTNGKRLDRVAGGFEGEANNCDIDDARSEMATTDNEAQKVRIHEMPSLRPLRSLAVPGARDLSGVCFARDGDRTLLFVTDESTDSVTALDPSSGEVVRQWRHQLDEVEAIACDDDWRRVILCDDVSAEHACQAYSYSGEPGAEFGTEVLGTDAEGVAIYQCADRSGYIVVSDQGENEFEVFRRDDFQHVCTFAMKIGSDITHDTDGIDILQSSAYPEGLFAACDGCNPGPGDEIHLAPWPTIAKACGVPVCPLPRSLD